MSFLADAELARLLGDVDAGAITCRQGLIRAYALGAEIERMEAMRRACEEYSRARQAREQIFEAETGRRASSKPPKPDG
jgi:hypothetical protein